jgi:hypothetical protein
MATKKGARKTTKKTTGKGGKRLLSDPPITIKGGSMEIEIDKVIFPQDPANVKKHSNASKKLATLEITDLKSPATTLLQVDLDELVQGKCLIIIRYR